MEDIRLYSFDFDLLAIESRLIGFDWTILLNGAGKFSAQLNANSDLVNTVLENRYLIATQGDRQAVITGIRIRGGEAQIFGRTPNWLMSRRVVKEFSAELLAQQGKIPNKSAETIARYIAKQAYLDVPEFVLADTVGITKEVEISRDTRCAASEVIEECLSEADAGYSLAFDPAGRRWVFSVIKGSERPLIISELNKNAYDTVYEEDLSNYMCGGWYELIYPVSGGYEHVWHYVEKDAERGMRRWECMLGSGRGGLFSPTVTDRRHEKRLYCAVSGLKHGHDYRLGDIVTLQKQVGERLIAKRQRIVGVRIYKSADASGEQPIFEEV